MYLLNVNTFELEEFVGDQVKEIEYAILSHTWEGKEVSFRDIQRPDAARNLKHPPTPAWSKVKNACAQARSDGYPYIWIDTCCIDKSSSAELQEAINSMFNWYLGSKSCYAFLSDVPAGAESIATSRWFTRGWTLQEFFAPNLVVFFNSAWTAIGTRGDEDVVESLSKSKTTQIEEEFLLTRNRYTVPTDVREFFQRVPVAHKMAWASGRQTTRVEDRAYSLLGLFDINMPLLYGEGDKAFQRLQHEIMRKSDDCTILAWGYGHKESITTSELAKDCLLLDLPTPVHLLARSPDDFIYGRGLRRGRIGRRFGRPSFSPSQRGFTMSLPLANDPVYGHIKYGVLACMALAPPRGFVLLPLINASCFDPDCQPEEQEYVRGSWYTTALESSRFIESASWANISIRQDPPSRVGLDHYCPRSLWMGKLCITISLGRSLYKRFTHFNAIYPPLPQTDTEIVIKASDLANVEALYRRPRESPQIHDVHGIQLCFGDVVIDLIMLYALVAGRGPWPSQRLLKCTASLLPNTDVEKSAQFYWLDRVSEFEKNHNKALGDKRWHLDTFWCDLGGPWKFEVRLECL